MKKLYYIFLLPLVVWIFGSLVTACGDNDDFTSLHILTDSELAELDRQQRERDSLAQIINADLILDYELTDYPITNWFSQPLFLDIDKVAELFGLTEDEVYAGIVGADGAPKIQGFAIQGTTHVDYLVASTTNGEWGHWWATTTDVSKAWNSDDSFFFLEWAYDWDEATDTPLYNTGHFNVGQMPDKWPVGTSATVLEGLSYQGKRVVFRITLKVVEREAVVASVVHTQQLSISMKPNVTGSYEPIPLKFDLATTLTNIGVSELTTGNLIAYMPDGSWAQEMSADNGWWFGKDGNAGSWGSDASAWVSYGTVGDDEVGVCLMPDNGAQSGDVYLIKFGFIANNKIEMLEITINIIDGDDPNSATITGTQSIVAEVTENITGSYDPTPVKFDLQAALSHLGLSSLKDSYLVAYTADGDLSMSTNADAGFWFDKSGPIGNWGADASCWISYGLLGDDEIGVCIMPDNGAVAGDEFHHLFGFFNADEGKVEMLDVTVKVTGYSYDDPETRPEGNPTTNTVVDVVIEKPWDDFYGAESFDIREALRNAFKLTTHEIYMASLEGNIRLYNKVVTGEPTSTGGSALENWLDLNGDAVYYGEGSAVYCGIECDNDYIEVYAGNFPDQELCPPGSEVNTTYIVTCNGGQVTLNITIKIGQPLEVTE